MSCNESVAQAGRLRPIPSNSARGRLSACATSAARVFDALAPRYDELWTQSTIGQLQRQAVWRRLDGLSRPGDMLLDLGCGTGADALHFMNRRMRVRAIDASFEMVRIARSRGVDATRLSFEELGAMHGSYDGVISD